MQDDRYKLSKKIVGELIFENRDCASKFQSLYTKYSPYNPTWAYIGSALGVAISEHPSKITLEKYNITAKLTTVIQDQDGNPLHFTILGEE